MALPVSMEDMQAEDRRLAEALAVLASPARLALLRHLRTPKALNEIRARPVEGAARAASPDRPMARQTVKEHLDRLIEIGVVEAREVEREGSTGAEYVLNHQALYSIAETFRGLARLRPAAEPSTGTLHGAPLQGGSLHPGPCLVLVKGLEEGRTFDLTPPHSGRKEWVIGRKRGLEVSLDFDPYVSAENAVVVWEEGGHFVQDLAESRNGTMVNFRPLLRSQRHALRTGDLIGVGSVLLMFRS